MKVSIFTGNQPRHMALVESVSAITDDVYVIQECTTVLPGRVAGFFRQSPVMKEYFARVVRAEAAVFGGLIFSGGAQRQLAIQSGDLSLLDLNVLRPALEADVCIVFGASFIRGPLCRSLMARRAVNIHMGTSPYYRGSSCNFWAMYDRRPEYVGATLHLLDAGLDSGAILMHAFPRAEAADPFVIGMKAVKAAQLALMSAINTGELWRMRPLEQDPGQQIRYTRNVDFTDEVASDYLRRVPTDEEMKAGLERRDVARFVRSFVA